MRALGVILILASAILLGFYFSMGKSWTNPYPAVCDLVASKIFLEPAQVLPWKKECLRRSSQIPIGMPAAALIVDLNHTLDMLKVSHLEIYSPAETQKIWQGKSKQNGLQSDFVESELVIFKVEPGSSAEKQGLKAGQIIVSINGEQPSPWTANSAGGKFTIHDRQKKHEQIRIVDLQPTDLAVNEAPEIRSLKKGVGLWTIPSFRREFFEDKAMISMAQEAQKMKSLVIDLRGNRGGNFVAGLRFLSFFMCQQQEVGILSRPQSSSHGEGVLQNNLSDSVQTVFFNQNKLTQLRAFPFSYCYNGSLKVLVDGKTASVAEMVAQALKEYRQAPLWGAPSAGELLVGVWYALDEVAPGVQISIPEGVYESSQGRMIEKQGVDLDRELDYKLDQMQDGMDSWVLDSL